MHHIARYPDNNNVDRLLNDISDIAIGGAPRSPSGAREGGDARNIVSLHRSRQDVTSPASRQSGGPYRIKRRNVARSAVDCVYTIYVHAIHRRDTQTTERKRYGRCLVVLDVGGRVVCTGRRCDRC